MRFTPVLLSLHIGNAFKNVWKHASKKKILEFGVRSELQSKGIQVVDAVEFLGLKPVAPISIPQDPKIIDGDLDESVVPKLHFKQDKNHPDWHEQPCRVYHDHTRMLTGMDEGANLVKSNVINGKLPDKIESSRTKLSDEIHHKFQQAVLGSHTLDALQLKLPRDTFRPGDWGRRVRRPYGLPKWRRNQQLLSKLFHICDTSLACEHIDVSQVQFANEVIIQAALRVDEESLLFHLNNVRQLLFGKKRLIPYADGLVLDELLSQPLPSIFPLKRTISVYERNVYQLNHKFPVRQGAPFGSLQMAVIHMNKPFMRESGSQLQARLLLHTFGVAASYAQLLYGRDVVELPEPLTINCLQSDSQHFIFGALQLHSLNLDGDDSRARNLFWVKEPVALFTKCEYVDDQPVLEGYNPQVAETLMSLYRSQVTA